MKKLLTLSILLLFSCANQPKTEKNIAPHNISTKTPQMQFNDYSSYWEQVKKFEKKGLTKSALEIVKKIYTKAEKEKNSPQIVKSLLYQSKYMLRITEEAQLKIIKQFEQEIAKQSTPTKNVLSSYLAQMYWQYYQQNRWKINQRSQTTDKTTPEDFRTWDTKTLYKEINKNFDNSLINSELLKEISIDKYSVILEMDAKSQKISPTLYDVLLHSAFVFYNQNQLTLPHPQKQFNIDKKKYFADKQTFVSLLPKTKDSLSKEYKAIQLLQNWLRFRQQDQNIDALAQADLTRLDYIYQQTVLDNKRDLYYQALQNFVKTYANSDVAAMASYKMANLLYQNGKKHNPKNGDKYQWTIKQAKQLCELTIQTYPNSNGAKHSQNLIGLIMQKDIKIDIANNIPEQKNALINIRYKNLKDINFKVFKVPFDNWQKIKKIYDSEKKKTLIFQNQLVDEWNEQLPQTGDYQKHQIETKLSSLDNALYVLYVSASENENIFGYALFQVTNIALQQVKGYSDQIITAKNNTYFIYDRNNGETIKNAKIQSKIFQNRKWHSITNTKTDHEGKFVIDFNKKYLYNSVSYTVHYNQNKVAYFNGNNYPYYKYSPREDTEKAFLFTDRAIYRPGQKVYFKGIALLRKKNKSVVLSNEKVAVTLFDANYQKLKSLKLLSNEYGSFTGEFRLPSQTLTGNFSIKVENDINSSYDINNEIKIKVEEYKRPKFEVGFNPVKESYKVNETISTKGIAKSFAGTLITDAKVNYHVKRQVRMPRWWYWYRPSRNYSEAQEIAHGTTTTNDNGEFEIKFNALPDLKVSKKDLPIFNYEILAEVTDVNGETHTATSTIRVGYHALVANMRINQKIDKNKGDSILISTKNLNGEKLPSKGEIKIYALQAPDRILIKRPWQAPDLQHYDKQTFEKLFPHIPYDEQENDYHYWQKKQLVFTKKFNTKNTDKLALNKLSNWKLGKYIAILETQDKDGQAITDKAFFDLTDAQDQHVPDKLFFTIDTDKAFYKPGEQVKLKMGSAGQGLQARILIEKAGKIIENKMLILNETYKTITVPVNYNDYGGFKIHYTFMAYNSFKKGHFNISVPFPSTEIEIETETFRDKLLPGQQETWRFKIKGPKSEKISAEVLASMYDASLDEFAINTWKFDPIKHVSYYSNISINNQDSFEQKTISFRNLNTKYPYTNIRNIVFARLKWFGFRFTNNYMKYKKMRSAAEPVSALSGKASGVEIESGSPGASEQVIIRGANTALGNDKVLIIVDGIIVSKDERDNINPDDIASINVLKGTKATTLYGAKAANGVVIINTKSGSELAGLQTKKLEVKARKNLQETAFFFPQLHTDKKGNVSFSFTAPEALTKWKLQLLAHDKQLYAGYKALFAQTQKDLMVFPNAPRFVREGDRLIFSTKISNLTTKSLNGTAELELIDALSGKDISQRVVTENVQQNFKLAANGNTQINWTLQIPNDVQAIQYKVMALSGKQSDAEQNVLPVLSNRILVTETMPMWVRSNQSKTFTMDKLLHKQSSSLKNHKLTLEITSNPAWYAVQSLPYLMEYPYECSEQTFSRFYANILASHIANSHPKIKKVFKEWQNTDSKSLLSNLEKNQALKSLIIEETPWLRDAQSESEQKKRIALLFDLNKMSYAWHNNLDKLQDMQLGNGGFTWFKGGRYADRYITQHIVTGWGHLEKLGVDNAKSEYKSMLKKALKYLDQQTAKDYKYLLERAHKSENEKAYLEKHHPGNFIIHYLYARSFFPKERWHIDAKIIAYYRKQAQKYWLSYNLYTQGMLALVSHRNDDTQIAQDIIKSLDQNSVQSPELGMYWKNNTVGWHWVQAPIETQSLLIEAFDEITGDIKKIDEMRIWLLKNKQTNAWKTTKQTSDAIYALLLRGTDWLSIENTVDVTIGKQNINPENMPDIKAEAGTGYFKKTWQADDIKPDMAIVKIHKKTKGIAWGGLYWQYFEDLDKISGSKTPISLHKELFIRKFTNNGEVIDKITPETQLQLGDLVRVRIEIKVDRDMEYVHLKDMRASGFEPINVLSQYKWQGGLGYYESTKDAATNFFISHLQKGVYVFEYDLRANNAGSFSNGITTIQCMYAPEFSSHSKGQHINILQGE